MKAISFKDELLIVGYFLLCWAASFLLYLGLWQLGVRSKEAVPLCNVVAYAGGIAVSRGRRQAMMQGIRVVRERISQFGGIRSERALIVRPPISRLDRIAQLFWSAKTYERVFKPARADILHEWQQAEVDGDRRRAQLIKYVRGPASMLHHMFRQLPISLVKTFMK